VTFVGADSTFRNVKSPLHFHSPILLGVLKWRNARLMFTASLQTTTCLSLLYLVLP